jgi:hypothetical protein
VVDADDLLGDTAGAGGPDRQVGEQGLVRVVPAGQVAVAAVGVLAIRTARPSPPVPAGVSVGHQDGLAGPGGSCQNPSASGKTGSEPKPKMRGLGAAAVVAGAPPDGVSAVSSVTPRRTPTV